MNADERRDKEALATLAIKTKVEEERRISLAKTERLKAQRLAKEATTAEEVATLAAAKAQKPKAKKPAKSPRP